MRETPDTTKHLQALAGIRVIDLSRQAPGPFCSMHLADFGADVILVEPPGGTTRGAETSTYWELERDQRAARHAGLRRNKRSIVLNLKQDTDRDVMTRLIRSADVVIEGFRPGVAQRLGVDWDHCRQLNPRLVYCSITGYGQAGREAHRAGHDINYLAEAGILEMLGDSSGRPAIPLNLLADFAGGGLLAAYAIMLALFHRERTGEGQAIDLAMVDGVISLLTHAVSIHLARGADLAAGRFFLSGALPQYNVYRCADGRWAAIGALEPWFFDTLMRLTGRDDLTGANRQPQRLHEVGAHLTRWFGERASEEILAVVGDDQTCVSLVNTIDDALKYAEARGMIVHLDDGAAQVGIAPKLSRTPGSIRAPSPLLDEHGAAIRADLNRSHALPLDLQDRD